jgi:signal peptide peptidase SppA
MAEARSTATVTGAEGRCRPDQLFGFWAIEPQRFGRMVPVALKADLEQLRREAAATATDRAGRPLYAATPDGIAIVEVTGPMTKYETSFQALLGGTATLRARQAIRAATRDPEIRGTMVVFDSPGGTIAGTEDLAEDIRAADARKPVFTYASDLMASAALWAGSAGRKLFANRSAEIGSIGVYAVVYDTSGLYAQEAVKVHVISSAPPLKGAGVDGTEITPPQLAEWERQVKDLADVFVAALAKGRRLTGEQARSLATGQVWVAEKARELGLIDGVLTLDEALERLRSEVMNEQDKAAAEARATEALAKAEAEKAAREKAEAAAAEAKAEAKAAKEALEKLQAEQRRGRFAKEVEDLGLPADFAAHLDAIEAAVPAATYAALSECLKAQREQIRAGAAFAEIGTGGGGATGKGAYAQAVALAEAKVKAGTAKSLATALSRVWAENPDLWKQYERERASAA